MPSVDLSLRLKTVHDSVAKLVEILKLLSYSYLLSTLTKN
jgi:hypothetical protein